MVRRCTFAHGCINAPPASAANAVGGALLSREIRCPVRLLAPVQCICRLCCICVALEVNGKYGSRHQMVCGA